MYNFWQIIIHWYINSWFLLSSASEWHHNPLLETCYVTLNRPAAEYFVTVLTVLVVRWCMRIRFPTHAAFLHWN